MIIPLHNSITKLPINVAYMRGNTMQVNSVLSGNTTVTWNKGDYFNGAITDIADLRDALEILLAKYLLDNYSGIYSWDMPHKSFWGYNLQQRYVWLSLKFKDVNGNDFYVECIMTW